MVGAAVGVAVPLVVAGVSGAVWQLYSTPDGTFIGNESILKYTVAPIAVVTSLALLPLTTAFGAWVGLVAEFGLDAGLEATLLPALGAGVAAPVGCVGGGMTGGVVGFVAGMLVTVPLVFLAAGSGGGGIYGLALIIFPRFVGGAVGLVGGALAGTVGAPLAVVHRGPWGSMSGPIGAQKPEDAE